MASSSSSSSLPNVSFLTATACTHDVNTIKELGKQYIKKFGKRKTREMFGAPDIRKGLTLLHHAAGGGQTPICKYLIETIKLDVNLRSFRGYAPLHCAVWEGQFMTSSYLLEHGALINLACHHDGITPLHCAAEKGRKDHLRLLITKGANINAPSRRGTPLQCAAGAGMKDAVKILLDHKADPNAYCFSMFTPLTAAIAAKSADCVRLLLKSGADPNFRLHIEQPFFQAVADGDLEIIKCLLKAGADPNIANFYNVTPIELAAAENKVEAVTLLLDATTPLPWIPDWSCQGILDHVNSKETQNEWKHRVQPKYMEAKENGVIAYKKELYYDAILWFSEVIKIQQEDHTAFSNRSLCHARLNDGESALRDAFTCLKLNSTWPKAYYRIGVAWKIMRFYDKAVEAFRSGLNLDPNNKELQDAYYEAEALAHEAHVAAGQHDAGCPLHNM